MTTVADITCHPQRVQMIQTFRTKPGSLKTRTRHWTDTKENMTGSDRAFWAQVVHGNLESRLIYKIPTPENMTAQSTPQIWTKKTTAWEVQTARSEPRSSTKYRQHRSSDCAVWTKMSREIKLKKSTQVRFRPCGLNSHRKVLWRYMKRKAIRSRSLIPSHIRIVISARCERYIH